MRPTVTLLAVAAASVVAAQSSSIDIDAISVDIPTTVFNLPVVYVTADDAPTLTATTLATTAVPSSDPSATNVFDSPSDVIAAVSSASAIAAATSASAASATTLAKRVATPTCVTQPTGIDYSTTPDTPAGWIADGHYAAVANANAAAPDGYVSSFTALNASNSADGYLGFTLMKTYDVTSCAAKCTAINGCNSFNVYFERSQQESQ